MCPSTSRVLRGVRGHGAGWDHMGDTRSRGHLRPERTELGSRGKGIFPSQQFYTTLCASEAV